MLEKSKAFPLDEILFATALVVIVIIVARFAWVYPATYLPRFLNKRLRERDPYPSWQRVFVIAFTGVRGAVSLAAALALPYTLANGAAFPNRDLILFISFSTILITLLGTGLLLPAVVRWLGVASDGRSELVAEHEAEIAARREALDAALRSLDAMTDDREYQGGGRQAAARGTRSLQPVAGIRLIPTPVTSRRRARVLTREQSRPSENSSTLLRDGKITDETRRRIERDLDLREASLANRNTGGYRFRSKIPATVIARSKRREAIHSFRFQMVASLRSQ